LAEAILKRKYYLLLVAVGVANLCYKVGGNLKTA
jgi:hypothetical protein